MNAETYTSNIYSWVFVSWSDKPVLCCCSPGDRMIQYTVLRWMTTVSETSKRAAEVTFIMILIICQHLTRWINLSITDKQQKKQQFVMLCKMHLTLISCMVANSSTVAQSQKTGLLLRTFGSILMMIKSITAWLVLVTVTRACLLCQITPSKIEPLMFNNNSVSSPLALILSITLCSHNSCDFEIYCVRAHWVRSQTPSSLPDVF